MMDEDVAEDQEVMPYPPQVDELDRLKAPLSQMDPSDSPDWNRLKQKNSRVLTNGFGDLPNLSYTAEWSLPSVFLQLDLLQALLSSQLLLNVASPQTESIGILKSKTEVSQLCI